MDWQFSDHSDDDTAAELQHTSRKRSSRACDQCRKTKSKCERTGGDSLPCKSCITSGSACTFLGPSYKRGPPKGYIHAIEQRWREVESLLGAIIRCPDPQVRRLISALSRDPLAREIIRKVDHDPFGLSGGHASSDGTNKEVYAASALTNDEAAAASETARSRRQSRLSREKVSSTRDNDIPLLPKHTKEWQDSLSEYVLAYSKDSESEPVTLHPRDASPLHAKWDEISMIESDSDEVEDAVVAVGRLALDEYDEVRYHGETSGLPILSRNIRTDDRNAGGLWRLPRAEIWPGTIYPHEHLEHSIPTRLPPIHHQDRLIALYFDYIHPNFPVLHKSHFLANYNIWKQHLSSPSFSLDSGTTSIRRDSSQEITPVLLYSIFSTSSRFYDDAELAPAGKMWEAGCSFSATAKASLLKKIHQSRPSTVQSLLLLGFREFGMGSMEQAWSLVGMAMRMAIDLGLNCNSSSWKFNGNYLFSPAEIQTRCQIWWCCTIVDRYGSLFLGRPIVLKDGDFDTPLPDVDPDEDHSLWPSVPQVTHEPTYPPSRGWTSSCRHAFASLTLLSGNIVADLYPVRRVPSAARKEKYAEIEGRLDKWFTDLPKALQFDATSRQSPIPPPHVLFLNLRYWGVALILNRAFITNYKGNLATDKAFTNTLELKAFDRAQNAANQISFIVTIYRETFGLKRVSPFLPSTILAASIMHLLTLTLCPGNVQASLGFQQCMTALQGMQTVWPSAARSWELLNGVKLESDDIFYPPQHHTPSRPAEPVENAYPFEQHSNHDTLERLCPKLSGNGQIGVQQLGTRIMSHVLGVDMPGIEPSYLPAFEWWPRSYEDSPPHDSELNFILPSTSTLPSSPMEPFTSSQESRWTQSLPQGFRHYHYNVPLHSFAS